MCVTIQHGETIVRTRILVADDHRLLREAISTRLSRETDMQVVGEAEDGRVAVRLARELSPDVVIMDVVMPNLNGVEATRQIVREQPATRVIAFSAGLDRHSVQEMLAAGAAGCLPKTCSFEELLAAVHNVVSNHTYLSPQVCKMVIEGYLGRSTGRTKSAYSELTGREREVLQLIAEGMSTKMIAKELCLSAKTIEWHRGRIMRKLGIESIAGLVRYAMVEGLTSTGLVPVETF
jgi:DNA-binding NarL/FixJ family response regulator